MTQGRTTRTAPPTPAQAYRTAAARLVLALQDQRQARANYDAACVQLQDHHRAQAANVEHSQTSGGPLRTVELPVIGALSPQWIEVQQARATLRTADAAVERARSTERLTREACRAAWKLGEP